MSQGSMESQAMAGLVGAGAAPASRVAIWIGRVLSAFPILMMGMSATMKFTRQPAMMEMWHGHFGLPDDSLIPIACAEALTVILYLIPQTAVLGAVLVAGFLGGAIATHVRVGDPFWIPLLLGIVAWVGLFLRDARLRALLPLRR